MIFWHASCISIFSKFKKIKIFFHSSESFGVTIASKRVLELFNVANVDVWLSSKGTILISTLTMKLSSESKYTGTLNGDNTAKTISLSLDSSSTITLTGDSYITSLEDADSSYSNINFNGYTLYVNGTAIKSSN